MTYNAVEETEMKIVTAEEKAAYRNITQHGFKLLALIQSAGETGTTRKELATALNKVLNAWDFQQLDLLQERGFITVEVKQVGVRLLAQYIYKAVVRS